MQLSTAFWAFKTLAAAHELDLFTRLSHAGGMTIGEVADELAVEERPAEMLLTGCAALGAPAALMSLNMLIETEGRNYTPAEYGGWLSDAGFTDIRTVWFDAPGANGAVVARKP